DGDDRWQIAHDRLSNLHVPPTLMGVLQARLDSLPKEERLILQQASVLGRIFWEQAVERLSVDGDSASETTARLLGNLRQRELVFGRETSAFSGTNEYIFKHALLRDVTYETVLKKARQQYHRAVAEWLWEMTGARMNEYIGLIAEHFEAAGDTARAIECLL